MGKLLDFLLTGCNWEETQRIQLYKKAGKKLDGMSSKEIDRQIEELKALKKKRK